MHDVTPLYNAVEFLNTLKWRIIEFKGVHDVDLWEWNYELVSRQPIKKKNVDPAHGCINRYDHVSCPGEKVSRAWRRFIIGFWVTHTHAVAWWPLWMHTTYNSVRQIDGRCRGRIGNLHSRICGSNGVRAISLCPLRENIEARISKPRK